VAAGQQRAISCLLTSAALKRCDATQSWADVPTCKEQGLDVQYQMLRVFMLPGKVPAEVTKYYTTCCKKCRHARVKAYGQERAQVHRAVGECCAPTWAGEQPPEIMKTAGFPHHKARAMTPKELEGNRAFRHRHHRAAEIAVGLVAPCAAGVVSTIARAGWAEDGPQAGYFPLRMGVAILIASIAVIVQALLRNDRSAFVEHNQLMLVATVLLPLGVYIATIKFIGIYVASALFIGIFMTLVGKFSWWRSTMTGVSVSLVLFWVFEMMFKVPLPKGPLEHLFGY
jgi:hypothetical protein